MKVPMNRAEAGGVKGEKARCVVGLNYLNRARPARPKSDMDHYEVL